MPDWQFYFFLGFTILIILVFFPVWGSIFVLTTFTLPFSFLNYSSSIESFEVLSMVCRVMFDVFGDCEFLLQSLRL